MCCTAALALQLCMILKKLALLEDGYKYEVDFQSQVQVIELEISKATSYYEIFFGGINSR